MGHQPPRATQCRQSFSQNAAAIGILCPMQMCPRSFSKDGFELHWATNHLGHAALTAALLPRLQSQVQLCKVVVASMVISETSGKCKAPLATSHMKPARMKLDLSAACTERIVLTDVQASDCQIDSFRNCGSGAILQWCSAAQRTRTPDV